MPDPSLLPDVTDAAKLGASATGGSLLTLFMGRLFGGQDKVLARLDVLQASIAQVQQQLAVVTEISERRDIAIDRLERHVAELQQRVASLEATVRQVSEGVAR